MYCHRVTTQLQLINILYHLSDSMRIGLVLIYNAGTDISVLKVFLSCLVGKKRCLDLYLSIRLHQHFKGSRIQEAIKACRNLQTL